MLSSGSQGELHYSNLNCNAGWNIESMWTDRQTLRGPLEKISYGLQRWYSISQLGRFSDVFKILTYHISYVLYLLQLRPGGNTADYKLTQVLYLCCGLPLQGESFFPFPSLGCRFPRQMSRSATETHITTAHLKDNTGKRSVQTDKIYVYVDTSSTPGVVRGFIFFQNLLAV